MQQNQANETPRYVVGQRGIQKLFNVSGTTAYRYRKGILREAITYYGRRYIVDIDKAKALYKAAKEPWAL